MKIAEYEDICVDSGVLRRIGPVRVAQLAAIFIVVMVEGAC